MRLVTQPTPAPAPAAAPLGLASSLAQSWESLKSYLNWEGGKVVTSGGTTYVVTGAGGNGFNAFALPQPSWSAFREASYYEYANITVSTASLRVDTIRADSNAIFDSVTIN